MHLKRDYEFTAQNCEMIRSSLLLTKASVLRDPTLPKRIKQGEKQPKGSKKNGIEM